MTATANDSSPAGVAAPSATHARSPLAEEIYQSTRDCHSKVIRLLAARLPLAIPPRSSDPGAYATGLLHLAPVYAIFETLWQQLLASPMEERMRQILEHVRVRELSRASRIKADVCEMAGWGSREYDEQVQAVRVGDLAQFVAHIQHAVGEKPHVLVSYSYLLYIGLFEGGRLIRATLENLPDNFWSAAARPSVQQLPLRFLRFDPTDGDELREEYEMRLAQVEDGLTPRERRDIIEEAHVIFDRMALLIAQIDAVTQTAGLGQHGGTGTADISASLLEWLEKPHGSRPRDSLLVAKERRSARAAQAKQGAPGQGTSSRPRGHARAGAEDDGTPADKGCDEVPRSIRFGNSLPVPPRGARRASASDDDLKKSQGLFDVAVAVRLAGLM